MGYDSIVLKLPWENTGKALGGNSARHIIRLQQTLLWWWQFCLKTDIVHCHSFCPPVCWSIHWSIDFPSIHRPLQTMLKIQGWTSQCFCSSHPLRKDFQTLEFAFGIRFHRLNDEKVTVIQRSPGTGKPMCQIYPTTFFVNKVLLERGHTHLITYRLWLLSYYTGRGEQLWEIFWSADLKYLLSGPLLEKESWLGLLRLGILLTALSYHPLELKK